MSAITVRKLPEEVKQRLRMRAAANGRSMEAEARAILTDTLAEKPKIDFFWIDHLIEVSKEVGGVDLEIERDNSPAPAAVFD